MKGNCLGRNTYLIALLLMIVFVCVACAKSDSVIEMIDNGADVAAIQRYSLIIKGDRYERFRTGVSDYSNHGNIIGEVKWGEDTFQVSEIQGVSPQIAVFVDSIVFLNASKSTRDNIIELQSILDFVSTPTQ
jgi:hypothetical protein